MSKPFLPYGRQTITDDDVSAVVHALQSSHLTQGPQVEAFEQGLCDYTKAAYATVCSSGTAALHLAYAALGLGPGDEIVTSPVTFAATANAARYLGADVRFADVDPLTGNLCPKSVAENIGPNTKGIVAVHLGGLPAHMRELRTLADAHDLWLVEDAAHALGATYCERQAGNAYSDVATFSFHPVKHLTTGEGGAVLTNDSGLKERMDRLRHHGIERNPERFAYASPGPWYHEVQELGYNYRLTDIQCALGVNQLRRQGENLARRRKIASLYRELFAAELSDAVGLQPEFSDRVSAYHLFPIQVDFGAQSRGAVMDNLLRAGIGTQVHYIPVNSQPYYRRLYGEPAEQPGVQHYYERTLSIPMYPDLTDADVVRVVGAVARAL